MQMEEGSIADFWMALVMGRNFVEQAVAALLTLFQQRFYLLFQLFYTRFTAAKRLTLRG